MPRKARLEKPATRPRTLRAIFALALAVRLVHVWQLRSTPFFSVLLGDARGYDQWAQQLAAGDWIGRDVFYQAPLYPYFLGVLYAVLGRDLLLVRIAQAVVGAASCALLASAVRRLVSPRAGVIAGVILAIYAPAIFFDGLLQKTVLDVFFVCLALWIISRLRARSSLEPPASLRGWLALGMTMGALALTRENALVLIVVVITWIAAGATRPRRARAADAAVFVAGAAIVLMPVAARNYAIGGGFHVTTSQMGPNFYIGNGPRADGSYVALRSGRGAPEYERQDATELAEQALGRRLSPSEVSSYWIRQALDFIRSHPSAWASLMARKTALLWNRVELIDTEDQGTYAESSLPLKLLGPVTHFGVLVPLAMAGAIVLWPRRREIGIVYALLLAYAASVLVFYVVARYRFPMVPMLVVFAAAALSEIKSLIPNPQSLAAAAVAAAAVNWPIVSADRMRAVTENNLGAALQDEGRIDDAIAHFRRSTSIWPAYGPAYNNLGVALAASGRVDEAVAAYEQSSRLDPSSPDPHYNLANVLMREGKADAAADEFRQTLPLAPPSADVYNNLGIAYASAGRGDAAIDAFGRALQLDPQSAKAHRNLGGALAAAGRGDDAIAHLRRAIELAPDDLDARNDLAGLLIESQRFADAAAEARAALAREPRSADAHNNLGTALASMGNVDEAAGEFEKAVALRPGFAEAQRNLRAALAARRR